MPRETVQFAINKAKKLVFQYPQDPFFTSAEESQFGKDRWSFGVLEENEAKFFRTDNKYVAGYIMGKIKPNEEVEVCKAQDEGEKYGHFEFNGERPDELKLAPASTAPQENNGPRPSGNGNEGGWQRRYSPEELEAFEAKDRSLAFQNALRHAVGLIQAKATVLAAKAQVGGEVRWPSLGESADEAIALARGIYQAIQEAKGNVAAKSPAPEEEDVEEGVAKEREEAFGKQEPKSNGAITPERLKEKGKKLGLKISEVVKLASAIYGVRGLDELDEKEARAFFENMEDLGKAQGLISTEPERASQ